MAMRLVYIPACLGECRKFSGPMALDCGSHVVIRIGLYYFNLCFDVPLAPR